MAAQCPSLSLHLWPDGEGRLLIQLAEGEKSQMEHLKCEYKLKMDGGCIGEQT